MAKYLVNYYETYSKSYEIEADSKEVAEEYKSAIPNKVYEALLAW